MFCPECGAEYRSGWTQCSDCRVALVEQFPGESGPNPDVELVTLLRSGDLGLLAVAMSILEDAGIDYLPPMQMFPDLTGLGRLTGPNQTSRPALIKVRAEDEAEARELLKDLLDGAA